MILILRDMKLRNILSLPFAACIFSACNQSYNINQENFNNNWTFYLVEDTANYSKDYSSTDYDSNSWENIRLPHTANIEPLIVNNQWQGICWYKKTFSISNYSNKKKYFIEFEGAMNIIDVWINDKHIKKDQGGYLPVVIDVTDYVNANKNIITVRLDNRDNPITGPKPLKILDFNMYGGLYREVNFIEKNKIYISNPSLVDIEAGGGIFITYPKVDRNLSEVKIKTNIINEEDYPKEVTLSHKIIKDNAVIKESVKNINLTTDNKGNNTETIIVLEDPSLWSPDSPSLYTLETTISDKEGNIIDKQNNRFGIRKFEFKDNQLYINGEKTYLRGVNRHQEYPYIGYALSDNAQYRDAYKIKSAGFDYVRLSHYPQSPAFMDACDELGLVVADAILGWQYYGDTDEFRNQCYRSAKQLIRRDRNHPSVLAWEVSLNETKMPIPFMEVLDSIVHKEYPSENVYSCGWMPEVYDIYFQARQHRILHKDKMMFDKPYIVSEYGDWEYYSNNAGLNQHKIPKNMRLEYSSRQFRKDGEERLLRQARNVQEAHNDNMNIPATGDGYWVMFDYNRGYHDDIEASGIMDIFRLPKFSYYFYKSQRDLTCISDCVLKIASYWNHNSPTDIKVYSNAEEIELYLNGKLIGKQKPDNDKNSTNLKHPPFTFKIGKFEKGELKAIAYSKGEKIKEESILTPETPVRLQCKVDVSGKKLEAGCNDVAFLYISAIDKNGTLVPEYTKDIDISLPDGIEVINKDEIKAEAGIATALIRIRDSKGIKKITVSDGVINGETEINIR